MKFKKIVSILLVIAIVASAGTTAFAKPGGKNKGMPPGQLKNMILKGNLSEDEIVELIRENIDRLSPGVLKEIIIKAGLSQDTIEEMAEEGLLSGLPSGILSEIMGYDEDDRYEDDDDEDKDDDEDNDEDIKEIDGEITGIDLEDEIIEIDGEEYEIDDDIEIKIDGEKAEVEDLKVGMEVEAELDDEEIEKIYAKSIEEKEELIGEITGIDLEDGILEISEEEYILAEDVVVEIDEEEAELDDLELGMEVEVIILNDEIVEVKGESIKEFKLITGFISDLDLIGIYHITVQEDVYLLSRNAEVTIDGENATLYDLEMGMKVEAYQEDKEVVRINAHNVEVEVEGTITEVNLEEGYLKIDDHIFALAEDVKVEINGEESQLEKLQSGMKAEAALINEKVVEISIEVEEDLQISGVITGIDLGDKIIVIDDVEYELANDVEVEINGEDAVLEDLELGMEIQIQMLNEKISVIEAEVITIEEVSGELLELDLIGIYHITIGDDEYQLSRDAYVTINDEDATLEDLEEGMTVTVELHNEEVVKIDAQKISVERIAGVITDLDLIGVYHITIGGNEYELSRDAEIIVNNQQASLDDLEEGMKVIVDLYNNEIVKAVTQVLSQVITEVEGRVSEINLITGQIVIDEKEYTLDDEVEVKVEGEVSKLIDLEVGMYLQIELVNNKVTKINARYIEEIEAQGIMTNIDLKEGYIEIDDQVYQLAQEVYVLVEGNPAGIEDLAIGMTVEVELNEGKVTKIAAENTIQKINGTIYGMNYTFEGFKLTIKVDEDLYSYLVSDQAQETYKDELSLGLVAQFTIANGVIVEVLIEE